jgi:hypothetical protein
MRRSLQDSQGGAQKELSIGYGFARNKIQQFLAVLGLILTIFKKNQCHGNVRRKYKKKEKLNTGLMKKV